MLRVIYSVGFDKCIMTSIHHHSITENGLCPKLALQVYMHAKTLQLCLTLCNPWTVACQAPISMDRGEHSVREFRQEYQTVLPCPTPGILPDPGIKLVSPTTPALQAGSLPLSHQGSP